MPYRPSQPNRRADVTDPSQAADFDTALAVVHAHKADGLGIRLGNGLAGIDLDHVRDPETGEVEPWAQEIVDRLSTYWEVSWSQTGLHGYVFTENGLPNGRRRKGRVELYSDSRFFVVTGLHLDGTPKRIEHRDEELAAVYQEVLGSDRADDHHHLDLDDVELIQRAREAKGGDRFAALWAGDSSAYDSKSESTLALLNRLAFWTGKDSARMDRLYRQSDLYREKFDERRGETTWGQQQIEKAVADCRDTYGGGMPDIQLGDYPSDETPIPEPEPEPAFATVTPSYSFVSRYVAHLTRRTDAPPEAHELMAVGVMSALAGPNPTIPMATSTRGDRLIQWNTFIVDSTVGRKSTVLGFARDIVKDILGEAASASVWRAARPKSYRAEKLVSTCVRPPSSRRSGQAPDPAEPPRRQASRPARRPQARFGRRIGQVPVPHLPTSQRRPGPLTACASWRSLYTRRVADPMMKTPRCIRSHPRRHYSGKAQGGSAASIGQSPRGRKGRRASAASSTRLAGNS